MQPESQWGTDSEKARWWEFFLSEALNRPAPRRSGLRYFPAKKSIGQGGFGEEVRTQTKTRAACWLLFMVFFREEGISIPERKQSAPKTAGMLRSNAPQLVTRFFPRKKNHWAGAFCERLSVVHSLTSARVASAN
jgi:hypothetical protein